jgi:hypothetical protein
LLFLISAAAVVFWVLRRDTIDTVTFHGTRPTGYGLSADHGVLRIDKTTLTTQSDQHVRFWHGREPIEASPNGAGSGGFGYDHFPSGSWSASAPLWSVALLTAALGAASLRRTTRARRRHAAEAEPAAST